jgi:hypothetical protein
MHLWLVCVLFNYEQRTNLGSGPDMSPFSLDWAGDDEQHGSSLLELHSRHAW